MSVDITPEILSPAGDFERLECAIKFGADAVYLGANVFTMRAATGNFEYDELIKATKFAHDLGKKVYLTCNSLPHNDELMLLPQFFEVADTAKVDALIIADIGVLALAKKQLPNMEIHASTQTGIVNYLTATQLYEMGVSRIVLARELSLEEISEMRVKAPKELKLEAFVHGAMCVSVSGRCLLSNYLVNRDANRGACAQPCRWGYYLVEEKRPNDFYKISEDESGSYILNAQDLCMIEHVDKLVKAGIDSFKIEGRAKSSYYVSVITNAYRIALDSYLNDRDNFVCPQWLNDEVRKVSHREYSTGFYFKDKEPSQCFKSAGYVREYDVVAFVTDYKDELMSLTQKNKFSVGDIVEILEPNKKPFETTIEKIIFKGEEIQTANHPLMEIQVPIKRIIKPGAIVRKLLTTKDV